MKKRLFASMAVAGSLLLAATGSAFAASWSSPMKVYFWSSPVKPGTTYPYPATQVGVRQSPARIQLTNAGKRPIALAGVNPITVSGAQASMYDVVGQPSGVLAPGQSKTFYLAYAPTRAGTNDALITIHTRDKAMPTFSFEVGSSTDVHPSGAGA